MLDILAFLNKLNHTADGLKVPYDIFHLNDLSEMLDIRIDYVLWLTDQNVIIGCGCVVKIKYKILCFRLVNCSSAIIPSCLTLKQKCNFCKQISRFRFFSLNLKRNVNLTIACFPDAKCDESGCSASIFNRNVFCVAAQSGTTVSSLKCE